MQLKSSYFLEGIKANFKNHFKGEVLTEFGHEYNSNWETILTGLNDDDKKKFEKKLNERQHQFDGLMNYLTWFDIDRELELPEIPNPVLAVVNNLISRGEFTKPSLFIENHFADTFEKTIVHSENGKGANGIINSVLLDNSQEFFKSVWDTLHILDTTAELNTPEQLRTGDSSFEQSFLLEYINGENSFLRQLLQQQRTLNSICLQEQRAGFKGSRVDFSIECPYYFDDEIDEYYWKRNFTLKRRHGLVIEIDGAPHHTLAPQTINDQNRDRAIKLAKWKVNRVTSANQIVEANNAINTLLQTPFIQTTKNNLTKTGEERKLLTQIALCPIAIARIQKTVVRYLISIGDEIIGKNKIKIGIIERDVPCGNLAVQDLNELIKNICLLKDGNFLPTVEATVFSDAPYSDSLLHSEIPLQTSNLNLDENDFDLLLDISVLRRGGIFLDDAKFASDKTILIRSVQYVEAKNENILCSDTIQYKEIVKYKLDGNYEEYEVEKRILKYFLQNIFRKKDFRIGQLPILNRALQLKSVIGLLPTGGGKSLTYQLAALLQPGITLVVDPIKSLMIDQYQNLFKTGIENCSFISSALDTIERQINISNFEKGEVQFCFISPERLVTDEFRKSLAECGNNKKYFSYCVIDEVHCVSEWGHDFRTPYLSLGKNARTYCPTFRKNYLNEDFKLPLYGLTATASFDVLADVERELEILADEADETIVSFENTLRDEIQYSLIETDINFHSQALPANQRLSIWLNPNLKGAAFWGANNMNAIDALQNVIDDFPLKTEIGKRKQSEVTQIFNNTFLQTFQYYSDEAVQDILLRISYQEYLDEKQKREFESEDDYVQRKIASITNENNIDATNLWTENKNGFIVFVPHRTSYFGVTDKFKNDQNGNPIPVARRHGVYDSIHTQIHSGIFMGSGDDADDRTSEKIQTESFKSQEQFINNEIAAIVATKAFGMGIDKPNIRATIHMNMPSSLESFVQESGRAGRDGKLAIGFLLYNKQILKYFEPRTYRNLFSGNTIHGYERRKVQLSDYPTCLQLRNIVNAGILHDKHRFIKSDFDLFLSNNPPFPDNLFDTQVAVTDLTNRQKLQIAAEEQWVDFDILEFFHYSSFKGIAKEIVILNELLNEISFPQRQKLKEIEEEFSNASNIELSCKFSTDTTYEKYIWINDEEGKTYGYLRTDTFNTRWKERGGIEQAVALTVLNQFKEFILIHPDFVPLTTNLQRHNLLKQMVMNPNIQGLIHLINNGDSQVDLELQNRYHRKKDNRGKFIDEIPETPWMQQMLQTLKNCFQEISLLPDLEIKEKILNNVFAPNQIQEPVETVDELWNNIEKFYQLLPNFGATYDVTVLHTPQRESALTNSFYRDRNGADTLKAVYRLLSIGIIDDYEIDYRSKTIKLKFTSENSPRKYKENLKEFVRRYYSEVQSQQWIDRLNIENENENEIAIKECLKILVEFVYNETEEKRFQGIKEMVEAIQRGLPQQGEAAIEGNKRFKEEIYYYFNAKYARRYVLPSGEPASLVADTDKGRISNFEICEKYFRVLSEDRGAYISNLKHLRGSTQKILRSVNNHNPCLQILKAFSLYQLSQTQTYFIDEVLNPIDGLFVNGFVSLFKESNWNLSDLRNALDILEEVCNRYFPDHRFKTEWATCRESIYLKHHNWWLTETINRIKTQANA